MNTTRKQKSFLLKNSNRFKQKLLHWLQDQDTFLWLDSNNAKGDETTLDGVMAIGVENQVEAFVPNAFEALSKFKNDINDWVFGYFSYDLKNELENLSSSNYDALHFPDLYFFQPKKLLIFKGNRVSFLYLDTYAKEIQNDFDAIKRTTLKANFFNTGINEIKTRITREDYINKVNSLLWHIKRGDIYEANFCQEFYAENTSINALNTFLSLNTISKSPFASFFKNKQHYAMSASPERYLRKIGKKLISQPIKGTAKRGSNTKEDCWLKEILLNDEKERSENIMIVDIVRNDLSRTAEKGTIKVKELCKLYSFKQVHQLISTVESRLRGDKSIFDVFKTTFPMGSMTGAPKISAMKLIEHFEETKRSLYSGAIGYITPSNDFDFNVVIRSILYNADTKYVSYSVGGAITAKSDPNKEYEECLIKARAMRLVLENNIFEHQL